MSDRNPVHRSRYVGNNDLHARLSIGVSQLIQRSRTPISVNITRTACDQVIIGSTLIQERQKYCAYDQNVEKLHAAPPCGWIVETVPFPLHGVPNDQAGIVLRGTRTELITSSGLCRVELRGRAICNRLLLVHSIGDQDILAPVAEQHAHFLPLGSIKISD